MWDKARIHHSQAVQTRVAVWQESGLFVSYLPPYSPPPQNRGDLCVNIVEVLWRKLKYPWLRPEDYWDE